VHPDSSKVQLPVLPDAKMDTRNEMRFPRAPPLYRKPHARHAGKDDGKVRGWRQYEVAQALPAMVMIRAQRWLERSRSSRVRSGVATFSSPEIASTDTACDFASKPGRSRCVAGIKQRSCLRAKSDGAI
jgi:hypothetical protein